MWKNAVRLKRLESASVTPCPKADPSYRGTSLIGNSPLPQDHHRTLDRPTVGSEGGAVSYERGTPVLSFPESGPSENMSTLSAPGARSVSNLQVSPVQGYLAHKKQRPPMTLQ